MFPLSTGVAYILRDVATGKVLDSNGGGSVYTGDANGGDFQIWILNFLTDGSGCWQLVDKATNRVLDGNNAGSTYTNGWNGGDYQKWQFVPDPSTDSYKIVQRATEHCLDSNSDCNAYLSVDNGGSFQRWVLTPAAVEVTADELVTTFENFTPPSLTPQLVSQTVVKNSSSTTTLQRTVSFDCTRSSQFEYGFNEKIGAELTVGGKVGVPLVAEGTASATFSVELGADQTWTTTTSLTYDLSDTLSVQPLSAVNATGYLFWSDDLVAPFTAMTTMRGKSGATTLPADLLIAYLRQTGCAAKLEALDGTNVRATFTGSLRGGWGVRTEVQVSDIPFALATEAVGVPRPAAPR